MPNELDQFLSDIQQDQTEADILNAPLNHEPEKGEEPEPEHQEDEASDDEEDGFLKPKTRRERRLIKKLQEERESSIFLAGKLEAREEAKQYLSDEEADYLKGIERIYGNDSPEAQLATDLLKKAIVGAREDAETRAYERIMSERQNEQYMVQQAESELDSIVEDIEDTFGVALSPAQERSYFELLQKMSPKDSDGEVISLADPYAVWEVFQERMSQKAPDNRAKSLSSRSMTQSGASSDTSMADDVVARQLRDMGII